MKLGLGLGLHQRRKKLMLPNTNLVFNGKFSTDNFLNNLGENPSIYYPILTDNGDGTHTITTDYTADNGFIGVPFNYIDETTIAFAEYFGDVDTQGNPIEDYEGGNALAPYCIVVMPELPVFDYLNETIWSAELHPFNNVEEYTLDLVAFGDYAWKASVLMRYNEFLRSLNMWDWMILVNKRENDGCIQQIVAYNPDFQGVYFDKTAASNATAFTRIGSLWGVDASEVPTNDLLPVHSLMRRCVVNDDLTVNYYLDANDSALKANGTPAVLDGTDGQVMVEIPAHYYYFEEKGTFLYYAVSLAYKKNWKYYPGGFFSAYEGQKYDAASGTIIGGAATGTWDAVNDKLCSVSGVLPYTDEKRSEYRAISANRGAGWHQQDNNIYAAVARLFITEYASFNTQGKISDGLTNAGSTDWSNYNGYSPLHVAGLTNSLGNASGEVDLEILNFVGGTAPLNTKVMSYRGIENLYGHLWKWLDGANIHNDGTGDGESKLYLCSDPANYADDVTTNYELAGFLPKTSGYIGDPLPIGAGFFPGNVAGSSTTGMCDYFYTNYDAEAASWRVAALGGHADNGVKAGAFCVHSIASSATDASSIGGRLCATVGDLNV